MPGHADDELLAAIQAMAATQEQMLRRQLATEQVFREVRDKVAQAVDVAADVKLLKYRIEQLTQDNDRLRQSDEQLFAGWRSVAGRILILYITIGIVLLVILIPIGILLFR